MTQTKREIQATLAAAGFSPLKRYGQHFLIDGNLMNKLVAAAEIRVDDLVLEVGPGTGSLTEKLLEVAGAVVAVEVDKGLYGICRDRFKGQGGLDLIHGDVLERKSVIAGEVRRALSKRVTELGGRLLLVSNLPYNIATPLVMDLLIDEPGMGTLCFTVQAEVGQRIMAEVGGKDYGPISIFAQALGRSKRIARVGPDAFWPRPKVESVMLRIDRLEKETLSAELLGCLVKIVHGCFNHRRKTMKSNLRSLLDEATYERVIDSGLCVWTDRPERISVEQWIALGRCLRGLGLAKGLQDAPDGF